MESKRGILTLLVVAAFVVLVYLPCATAQGNNDENTRVREGQRMSRPGGERSGFRPDERGERGGRGGARQGRGGRLRPDGRRRRPELTDEQIDSVLEELTKRDPNTAKELADMRKKDPNEFRNELRKSAWPEIGRIIMSSWAVRIRSA